MIPRLLLLAASTLSIPVAEAFEARLAAGLAVTIERIREPLAVDGVAMTVHRATGAGVPELARRIEQWWRSQGSEVRSLQQDNWLLRSRMQGARSEVMQWRTAPGPAELLWSALDTAAAVRSPSDTGLALPAVCTWGRSVSGSSGQHRYLQRTARCALPMSELSALLQKSMPSQGWRLRSTSDSSLLLERPGAEGLLSLLVRQDDSATWLTWLRVEQPR